MPPVLARRAFVVNSCPGNPSRRFSRSATCSVTTSDDPDSRDTSSGSWALCSGQSARCGQRRGCRKGSWAAAKTRFFRAFAELHCKLSAWRTRTSALRGRGRGCRESSQVAVMTGLFAFRPRLLLIGAWRTRTSAVRGRGRPRSYLAVSKRVLIFGSASGDGRTALAAARSKRHNNYARSRAPHKTLGSRTSALPPCRIQACFLLS